MQNSPAVSNQFPAHGGGATISVSISTPCPGPRRISVEIIDQADAFDCPVIVTPEGAAYLPSAIRMTGDQLCDWIDAMSITLPSREYVAAQKRRLN